MLKARRTCDNCAYRHKQKYRGGQLHHKGFPCTCCLMMVGPRHGSYWTPQGVCFPMREEVA